MVKYFSKFEDYSEMTDKMYVVDVKDMNPDLIVVPGRGEHFCPTKRINS
jgi:hypothetical protein